MPKLAVDRVPKYRCHARDNQGVVRLNGRDHYLGRYGTPESEERYDRLIAEWLANRRLPIVRPEAAAHYTVKELVLAYYRYAEGYYTKAGKPTSELGLIGTALRMLRELYGSTPAADFTSLRLKAVREKMVGEGWSRDTVNRQVNRIKRAFSWAVEEGLPLQSVTHALCEVKGLKEGRCGAPESPGVGAVPDEVVDATLPHMTPVVRDMVEIARLVGTRPCELTAMRPCDIDRTGDVWIYRVVKDSNKTAHHGKRRVVAIGPRAQDILRPYLLRPADSYCFSPRESEAKRLAELHAQRQTPMSCGNRPKAKKPSVHPAAKDRYTTASIRQVIHRACAKAFPAPEGLDEEAKKRWVSDHEWNTGQLRHNVGTEVRRQYGLDGGQAVLGHSKANTTELYAEVNMQRAVEIARQIG